MRWRTGATALLLACLVTPDIARGQAAAGHGPVVSLQPGMLTADFVSAPESEPATTGFNLRFIATLPTRVWWLTLYLGGSVTPYGTSGASRRNTNAPALFVGNVVPIVRTRQTAGWLSLDAPLALTYTFGGGGDRNARVYGKDVALELSGTLHVGAHLLSGFGGALSRLRAYGVLQQSMTPNRDLDGRRDRFNPIAFYGVSLPFGSGRESP